MSETRKALQRRLNEGFFEKYMRGSLGIDIGCGSDKITVDPEIQVDEFDLYQGNREGDATYMEGVPDGKYDWVYSSHCLEHLDKPRTALLNWWRILRNGGNLIVVVPHRDLYEKKKNLPSRWNLEHKNFYVMERSEPPDTIGLLQLTHESLELFGQSRYELLLLRKCDDGHTISDPERHSDGEFSIEMVLKKL